MELKQPIQHHWCETARRKGWKSKDFGSEIKYFARSRTEPKETLRKRQEKSHYSTNQPTNQDVAYTLIDNTHFDSVVFSSTEHTNHLRFYQNASHV